MSDALEQWRKFRGSMVDHDRDYEEIREQADALATALDRLDSFDGHLDWLREHYPETTFTGASGDVGAVNVVLSRKLLEAEAALARYQGTLDARSAPIYIEQLEAALEESRANEAGLCDLLSEANERLAEMTQERDNWVDADTRCEAALAEARELNKRAVYGCCEECGVVAALAEARAEIAEAADAHDALTQELAEARAEAAKWERRAWNRASKRDRADWSAPPAEEAQDDQG